MKLEINYKKKTGKDKCVETNKLLNNQRVDEEIKEEIKKYLDKLKLK